MSNNILSTSAFINGGLNEHISNKSNPHNVTLSQLGVNASATELNYVDGVTSNIQTQLNNLNSKLPSTYSIYNYTFSGSTVDTNIGENTGNASLSISKSYYLNGKYFYLDKSGNLYYSTDMYTLTKVTALNSYRIVSIAYSSDHNAYIAVSSGTEYWFYSTNGTSWTTVSNSTLTSYAYNIVYDSVNKKFVVRTDSSIDNINFNTKTVTKVNTGNFGSYIECIDGIVYCWQDGVTSNVESVFYTSTNSGKTFTQRTMPTDPNGVEGCYYIFKKANNKIYCFAQNMNSVGRIYVSDNGINFRFLQRTETPLSGDYGICDIKYINGYYIAVGRRTFISFDGEYFFYVPTNSGSNDSVFNQSYGDHVEILVAPDGKLHATRNTTSSINTNNIILPTPNKITKNIKQLLEDIYFKIYLINNYN